MLFFNYTFELLYNNKNNEIKTNILIIGGTKLEWLRNSRRKERQIWKDQQFLAHLGSKK